MPIPLAVDLRKRVVAMYEAGGTTYEEVADHFSVGRASVSRWLRRNRELDSVDPEPARGGPAPQIDEQARKVLRSILEAEPDLTIAEIRDRLEQSGGPSVGRVKVGKAIRSMGFTRKKRLFLPPSVKRNGSRGYAKHSNASARR